MADNFKNIKNLDIPFKEFMPGQIISSTQFNDDMGEIEEKINEIVGEHNSVANTVVEHLNNTNNPHQVTAHQVGAYTTDETDGLFEEVRNGELNDNAIKNRVLADDCVENRNIKDRTITAIKVDEGFGSQLDISENIEITDRYTKAEVNEIVQNRVGDGTYTKEELDQKFQDVQVGQIIDKTISADKVTSDFGDNVDISNNPSIESRYTKSEVDRLISTNGLPRDWGSISDKPTDVENRIGSLPVAGHMVAGQFTSPATSVLDIDVKENVEARGEYNSVGERLNGVDSQIKDIAKDLLLENGKLYLKKSDGTKLGDGVILPVSGSGGSVAWESITGKPATFTPSSHSHSKSDITDFPTIPTKTSELNNDSGFLTSHQDLSDYVQKETGKGLSTNDLTTTLKQNYDNAYTHSQSTHAPANAQKNSDITKEEIEAKLTGEISSHSHANSSVTGSEFKKVIETTFREDCYAFTVTQDKDGNPLQLKEGIICITASQPKNTETQISFGVGFLDWKFGYNSKSSIYNVALMKNYEFYRLHVYFKIINNKVLAINLGTIRTGTVAPSFNNFDNVNLGVKVGMSSFRTLQNNYIDKIVIGLDMANTGLISGDSILEVWSI